MSYNYRNMHGNNFTFQTRLPYTNVQPYLVPPPIPPPPLPPPYFIPPVIPPPPVSDQELVQNFMSNVSIKCQFKKAKLPNISEVRERLQNIIVKLNELKNKEKLLYASIETLTEQDWNQAMQKAKENKAQIQELLAEMNYTYLETMRKVVSKRISKRLRLKRLKLERKREKEETIKKRSEESRKIDENLQKIKDEILKKKQEEEARLHSDTVLKDVLRKKHDAKKCLEKLELLVKLRKARQNTAKGRGETVSENDSAVFGDNIDKLKSIWVKMLTVYEKEEIELRDKLKVDTETENLATDDSNKEVISNLNKWKEYLFGNSTVLPQQNFNGDLDKFISNRYQWDQYVDKEGSTLPIGWVVPHTREDI